MKTGGAAAAAQLLAACIPAANLLAACTAVVQLQAVQLPAVHLTLGLPSANCMGCGILAGSTHCSTDVGGVMGSGDTAGMCVRSSGCDDIVNSLAALADSTAAGAPAITVPLAPRDSTSEQALEEPL